MKKVCVVGLGAIGPVHIDALSKLSEYASLYAVCDIVKEKADHFAQKHSVKAYYDFDEALCDDEIDSFHICTPHYLHIEMIEKCLAKGKMVVSEKPLVMTKEEFLRLKEKDTSNLCCIFQNRTNKSAVTLFDIIKNDTSIGEIKGSRGILTWTKNPDYYRKDAWRGKWATEGGGVLINQSIHTLDLVCHFTGEVESVIATMANHALQDVIEVEDTMEAYIKFKNGTTALFYASNASTYDAPTIVDVHFTNAHFTLTDGKLTKNGEVIAKDTDGFIGKKYWGNGHLNELYNIYVENKPLRIKDIENTMNTVFALYESAKSGGKEIVL